MLNNVLFTRKFRYISLIIKREKIVPKNYLLAQPLQDQEPL